MNNLRGQTVEVAMLLFSLCLFLGMAPLPESLAPSAGVAHAADRAFSFQYKDLDGVEQNVRFSLPAERVEADMAAPLHPDLRALSTDVAAAVNEWAKGLDGVEIKAKATGPGTVTMEASGQGKKKVEEALAEAGRVRDAAQEQWLVDHDMVELEGRGITWRHARLASLAAEDLAPVVAALGGPGKGPRDFARRALPFVQSIPYEKRVVGDAGFRRPLAVLAANTADCDGKVTLFLGLMRAAWPDVPLGIAITEEHAFAAMGVKPKKGELQFKRRDQKWVVLEPVGPFRADLGEADTHTRKRVKQGRFQLRMVPAG